MSVPAVRAWCLLPVKLAVSLAASARIVPVSLFFHFSVWELWELSHFPSVFFSSGSLFHASFTSSAACVSVAASHQINLHLPQHAGGDSITNFTSRLRLSVDGFEVCCEMCGWRKKRIFRPSKKKMITYHFFCLGSQPVEIDLLSAVSPSVSFFFFSACQGLSGATTRARPCGSPSPSLLRFPPRLPS